MSQPSTQSPRDGCWTVLKFGGAALRDGESLRRVAAILRERAADGAIAVVSAVEGVTDLLDQLAGSAAGGEGDSTRLRLRHRSLLSQLGLDAELCDRHLAELAAVLGGIARRGKLAPPERDHVLSFGERMSARIVAAVLRAQGIHAAPIDAFDLGLCTDSNHGRARPLPGCERAVRDSLGHLRSIGALPVVTGFVSADASGALTTLGRNGSDLSAALIAEAARAREVQFWKTVDGVMTADPALVPGARPIRALSYAQAELYARHGARVLHPEALEPLARAAIPARVLCLERPEDPGTSIGVGPAADGPADSMGGAIGIAARSAQPGLASIALVGLDAACARAARPSAALRSAGIRVLAEEAGGATVVVEERDLPRAAQALHEAFFGNLRPAPRERQETGP